MSGHGCEIIWKELEYFGILSGFVLGEFLVGGGIIAEFQG
jgi:hypothetical protein